MVGFGWWLCWALGLFTVVREGKKRDRNERERERERGEILFWDIYIFYYVDILF